MFLQYITAGGDNMSLGETLLLLNLIAFIIFEVIKLTKKK